MNKDIGIIIDKFWPDGEEGVHYGRCKVCGQEKILAYGVCCDCLEAKYGPLTEPEK